MISLKICFSPRLKALETIKRSPGLLQRNIETCMAPNVNIFRENGVPESNIITFLQTQPRASFVNPVLFRELVEEVKEMGFNRSTMKFAEALHVLQAMSKSTWERKFNAYQKWGLSGDRICLAFRRNPWCMAVSEDKIMRVMEFLVNKMGMESFHYKQIPQYLFDIVCKSD